MNAIPFVDAHMHLWDPGEIRYPWLTPPFGDDGPNGRVAQIAGPYLVEDYLAEAARWNVVGAVHIDAGADPTQALDETRWLETLAAKTGLPSAIIGFAALNDPAVEGLLAAQAAHPRVRGIRHIVNWHRDSRRTYSAADVTQDEQWWQGYALLGKYGLSFDLQCYPGQMPGLVPLIERFPETRVAINHIGMPVASDAEGIARWRYGLKVMAAIPHVSIKLSGLGFIHRKWSLDSIRPFLEEAIECFGTERAMFASDAPTDTLFAPLDTYLEAYHSVAEQYSQEEQRALFGRNASAFYRLGLDL